MTTMHFNAESNQMANFWARGSSCAFLGIVYLLNQVEPTVQMNFCTVFNIAVGILYPWNAEYITKIDCKPLHKFPTVLFVALSVASLLAR